MVRVSVLAKVQRSQLAGHETLRVVAVCCWLHPLSRCCAGDVAVLLGRHEVCLQSAKEGVCALGTSISQ